MAAGDGVITPPLWAHQQGAIDFTRSHGGKVLLDMGMGSGKSRVVVAIADRLIARRDVYPTSSVLIVCPSSVRAVWRKQFETWRGPLAGGHYDVLILMKGTSVGKVHTCEAFEQQFKDSPDFRQLVVVVNYETMITPAFQKYMFARKWTLAVLDESHRIKDAGGVGGRVVPRIRAVLRLCLTGTPLAHSPLDIFSQARFLDPRIFGFSWIHFRSRYAVMGVPVPKGLPTPWQIRLESLERDQLCHAVTLLNANPDRMRSDFRKSLRALLQGWISGQSLGHLDEKGRSTPFTAKQWQALGKIDAKRLMKVIGLKNKAELQAKMSRFLYRIKTEDVLDLPPEHHVERMVELDPNERAVYDYMSKEFVSFLSTGQVISAANVLDRLLKLQQISSGFLIWDSTVHIKVDKQLEELNEAHGFEADMLEAMGEGAVDVVERTVITRKGDHRRELLRFGRSKMLALQEILEDLPPDEPVVVFALFHDDLNAIAAASEVAGRQCFELSGREQQLEEWQDAKGGEVLAAQVRSGGVGISLVRARYCCCYSLGFSLADYLQLLARVRRPGQERAVTYFHLIARDTINERVYQALRRRRDVVEEVLDGIKNT